MKETHMPLVHTMNLMANSGNTAYGVESNGCCIFVNMLQWRHNERDGVSNHRRLDCLLNRLFWYRSKKISNLRVTRTFARGIHRWPMTSEHKEPVTRKRFPFDDVVMICPQVIGT